MFLSLPIHPVCCFLISPGDNMTSLLGVLFLGVCNIDGRLLVRLGAAVKYVTSSLDRSVEDIHVSSLINNSRLFILPQSSMGLIRGVNILFGGSSGVMGVTGSLLCIFRVTASFVVIVR